MRKLSVELVHCHGIKKLKQEFVFDDNNRSVLIYAPNGVMKSSFTRTFKNIAEGSAPQDRIYPQRATKYSVIDENGKAIDPGSILIIDPFIGSYESTGTSSLVADRTLKEKYDLVHRTVTLHAENLYKALRAKVGSSVNVENEISSLWKHDSKNMLNLLEILATEVQSAPDFSLVGITYKDLINPKIAEFLKTPSVQAEILQYVRNFESLTAKSAIFKKDGFNHNHATELGSSLADTKFFSANHHLVLNVDGKQIEIRSADEMNKVVEEEKKKILSNPELVRKFEALDKQMNKNEQLRTFRQYLASNHELIPQLLNFEAFKKKIWLSLIKSESALYSQLLKVYGEGKIAIENIIAAAKSQSTEWAKAVDTFNTRFDVPFTLTIENQEDVILSASAPKIAFIYRDGTESANIDRAVAEQALSRGEQRALYLLNVIFDIEARKRIPNIHLLVFDDVADSFDYRNKYAILEYLNEVKDTPNFRSIILTHNFDFFRTAMMRLEIDQYRQCYLASKETDGITLRMPTDVRNPFGALKAALSNTKIEQDEAKIIALIPFVRNLIEFGDRTNSESDLTLFASALHHKEATSGLKISDLKEAFTRTIALELRTEDSRLVLDAVYEAADRLLDSNETMQLYSKVVLSIAIRLRAEKFMISAIAEPKATNSIKKNQTSVLLQMLKSKAPNAAYLKTLSRVLLMTSENIHLNSFMYEPILDLSEAHLKTLYREVKALDVGQ